MKRTKFISNLKYPNANIKVGQEWTRKADNAEVLNNPFVIKIIERMDRMGTRFEVDSKRGILYFDRTDIIENYNLRTIERELSINERIAEIRGFQFSKDRFEQDITISKKGIVKAIPEYDTNAKKADMLLKELEPFKPHTEPKMGYYEMTLSTSIDTELYFKDRTREKVVAKAYLSIFG